MGFIKTNKTLKKLFHEKDISKIENYFRKIENPSAFHYNIMIKEFSKIGKPKLKLRKI
jgi:hypothetical protein